MSCALGCLSLSRSSMTSSALGSHRSIKNFSPDCSPPAQRQSCYLYFVWKTIFLNFKSPLISHCWSWKGMACCLPTWTEALYLPCRRRCQRSGCYLDRDCQVPWKWVLPLVWQLNCSCRFLLNCLNLRFSEKPVVEQWMWWGLVIWIGRVLFWIEPLGFVGSDGLY
jgi:hypothetical protein